MTTTFGRLRIGERFSFAYAPGHWLHGLVVLGIKTGRTSWRYVDPSLSQDPREVRRTNIAVRKVTP